jgi:hypothetical protein
MTFKEYVEQQLELGTHKNVIDEINRRLARGESQFELGEDLASIYEKERDKPGPRYDEFLYTLLEKLSGWIPPQGL